MPSETRRYRFQTAWCTAWIIGCAMFQRRVGFGRFALSVWNFPRFGILWFDFKNGLNRRTDVLPVSVPVWCGMMVQAEFIFVRQPARSGKIKF